jgi:hypothetical protein
MQFGVAMRVYALERRDVNSNSNLGRECGAVIV